MSQSELKVIPLHQASPKIYPRDVRGRFTAWRIYFVLVTQLLYLGMPWINWHGRQAVLFDLEHNKFYLFGVTFWPQDFVYLAAILMCSAFGLFLWTTIAGRLWCGYSCPQTVYTEIMLWIERLVEGNHNRRIKLDQQPMSAHKLGIKTVKHGLMLLFSLWTGVTLVGYYTPIHQLMADAPNLSYGSWEIFWMLFYGGFTYLFAALLREQVCKYMCPYARFQSVMFDADTLVISYDAARGEARGGRKKGVDPKAAGLGDCINCGICVQVCPVGIDIRDGLQYECIGCAACVDACDDVMDQMNYPRGLVSYTTENVQQGKYSAKQIKKHILRPRVLLYSLILLAVLAGSLISFAMRLPFKVDIIRDRSALVRVTNDGQLENSYMIHIMNVSNQTQHFKLSVNGLPSLKLHVDGPPIVVRAGETQEVNARVQAEPQDATTGGHEINFVAQLIEDPRQHTQEASSFIGQ